MQEQGAQVTIEWLLPGKIIYQKYSGKILLTDIAASINEVTKSAKEMDINEPFHVIIDVTDRSQELDFAMFHPINIRRMLADITDNASNSKGSWVVVVDPNPRHVIAYIVGGLLKRKGIYLHVERSLEGARKFLEDKLAAR